MYHRTIDSSIKHCCSPTEFLPCYFFKLNLCPGNRAHLAKTIILFHSFCETYSFIWNPCPLPLPLPLFLWFTFLIFYNASIGISINSYLLFDYPDTISGRSCCIIRHLATGLYLIVNNVIKAKLETILQYNRPSVILRESVIVTALFLPTLSEYH